MADDAVDGTGLPLEESDLDALEQMVRDGMIDPGEV